MCPHDFFFFVLRDDFVCSDNLKGILWGGRGQHLFPRISINSWCCLFRMLAVFICWNRRLKIKTGALKVEIGNYFSRDTPWKRRVVLLIIIIYANNEALSDFIKVQTWMHRAVPGWVNSVNPEEFQWSLETSRLRLGRALSSLVELKMLLLVQGLGNDP